MSRFVPSTADGRLQDTFGAPVADLHATAVGLGASAALARALELRSSLALAEEQVARVRDRVHQATTPDRDMDKLSAGDLRLDAQWLEAALAARDGYQAALGEVLRTMPPPDHASRPAHRARPSVTAPLPPPLAAPSRAGAVKPRRP